MSIISFGRRTRRGATLLRVCVALAVLLAILVSGRAMARRFFRQQAPFVHWPRELASRAPTLADAIERDFGDRPYVMAFAGRDTMKIFFWNPSFWRNDLRPTFPEASLPLVEKSAHHLAEYVLKGFGREAGVNFLMLTFIRARRENHLGLTRTVPAQQVTGVYTPRMFEPNTREFSVLSIMER